MVFLCAFRPPLFGPNKPAETEAAETNKINEKKDQKNEKDEKTHKPDSNKVKRQQRWTLSERGRIRILKRGEKGG